MPMPFNCRQSSTCTPRGWTTPHMKIGAPLQHHFVNKVCVSADGCGTTYAPACEGTIGGGPLGFGGVCFFCTHAPLL
eukprot:2221236-Amphidinium_carterae.3